MELFLRAFADCDGDSGADQLQRELCAALTNWASAKPMAASRYWKMPELFEFTFSLMPATIEVRDAIVDSVRGGWHISGDETDRSFVWNRSPGLFFLTPEVAWAELQHYAPAP
jgi:hypothetical protein